MRYLRAGQNPDIVRGAVPFVMWNAPALYFYTLAECLKRYLMAQVRLGCSVCSAECTRRCTQHENMGPQGSVVSAARLQRPAKSVCPAEQSVHVAGDARIVHLPIAPCEHGPPV